MTTEIIQRPESSVALNDQIPANSPMGMMMAAVQQGIALEQVEKMMDLQERWEQREAEKAFNDAMAAFKSEAVEIIKSRRVSFAGKNNSHTNYAHEELSDVVEAVGPALSKHGFAWSWKTEQEGSQIRVTCILKHRHGHSESVTLQSPPDNTGNKNGIQAIGSTVSYLERYTLRAITGVAAKGQDDDGATHAGPSPQDSSEPDISPEIEAISRAQSIGELKAVGKAASEKYPRYRQDFLNAYGERKKALDELEQAAKAGAIDAEYAEVSNDDIPGI